MAEEVLGSAVLDLDTRSKKLDAKLKKTKDQLKGVATAMLAVGAAMTGLAALSVKAASDRVESEAAVRAVFKSSADEILRFGKQNTALLKVTSAQYGQLATVTGAMLKNMGLSTADATDKTIALSKVASDMASVFNKDVSQALAAVNAGLRGETDPLEQFGIKVTAADIATRAMAMGLAQSTAELTQAAKAQAFYALILEQTTDIQGEAEKTAGEFASQWRLLQAEIKELAADVGDVLLPIVKELMQVVIPAVQHVRNWISENPKLARTLIQVAGAIGVLLIVASGILGAVVSFLAVKAAVLAAGIAITALLGPIALVVAAIAAIAAAGWFVYKNWDAIRAIVGEVWKSLKAMAKDMGAALRDIARSIVTEYDLIEQRILNFLNRFRRSKLGVELDTTGGLGTVGGEGQVTITPTVNEPEKPPAWWKCIWESVGGTECVRDLIVALKTRMDDFLQKLDLGSLDTKVKILTWSAIAGAALLAALIGGPAVGFAVLIAGVALSELIGATYKNLLLGLPIGASFRLALAEIVQPTGLTGWKKWLWELIFGPVQDTAILPPALEDGTDGISKRSSRLRRQVEDEFKPGVIDLQFSLSLKEIVQGLNLPQWVDWFWDLFTKDDQTAGKEFGLTLNSIGKHGRFDSGWHSWFWSALTWTTEGGITKPFKFSLRDILKGLEFSRGWKAWFWSALTWTSAGGATKQFKLGVSDIEKDAGITGWKETVWNWLTGSDDPEVGFKFKFLGIDMPTSLPEAARRIWNWLTGSNVPATSAAQGLGASRGRRSTHSTLPSEIKTILDNMDPTEGKDDLSAANFPNIGSSDKRKFTTAFESGSLLDKLQAHFSQEVWRRLNSNPNYHIPTLINIFREKMEAEAIDHFFGEGWSDRDIGRMTAYIDNAWRKAIRAAARQAQAGVRTAVNTPTPTPSTPTVTPSTTPGTNNAPVVTTDADGLVIPITFNMLNPIWTGVSEAAKRFWSQITSGGAMARDVVLAITPSFNTDGLTSIQQTLVNWLTGQGGSTSTTGQLGIQITDLTPPTFTDAGKKELWDRLTGDDAWVEKLSIEGEFTPPAPTDPDIKNLWEQLQDSSAWQKSVQIVATVTSSVASGAQAVWDAIKSTGSSITKNITAAITGSGAYDTLRKMFAGTSSNAAEIWGDMKMATSGIWTLIKKIFEGTSSRASDIWGDMKMATSGIWTAIQNLFGGGVRDITIRLMQGSGGIYNTIARWQNSGISTVLNLSAAVGNMWKNVVNSLISALNSLLSRMQTAFRRLPGLGSLTIPRISSLSAYGVSGVAGPDGMEQRTFGGPQSAGTTINLNFYGDVYAMSDFEQKVRDLVYEAMRNQRKLGVSLGTT